MATHAEILRLLREFEIARSRLEGAAWLCTAVQPATVAMSHNMRRQCMQLQRGMRTALDRYTVALSQAHARATPL